MQLDDFKSQCIALKPDVFVQKYLIENETFFFKEVVKGEEFDFKKDFATILGVHVRDITIVGSAKLGFSIKPEKGGHGLYKFKEFDYKYNISPKNERSDIDVAIISSTLFDKEIKNLYEHTGYYKRYDRSWQTHYDFASYVLKGRFAIRFLPLNFPLSKEISEAQTKYKMIYGRTVNIEIYKSWYFFETYHQENIKTIQVNLIR